MLAGAPAHVSGATSSAARDSARGLWHRCAMERRPVPWPDPDAPRPAALAELAWGDPPPLAAAGDIVTVTRAAQAGTSCFGVSVEALALGYAHGGLVSVRLTLGAAPSARALVDAGLALIDEHYWSRADADMVVEIDALDRTLTLTEAD